MRKLLLLLMLLLCVSAAQADVFKDSVTASADDAGVNGAIWSTSSTTQFAGHGVGGDFQKHGFRWQNVAVPQGSTIDSAVIRLWGTAAMVNTPDWKWVGVDVDDADAWTTEADFDSILANNSTGGSILVTVAPTSWTTSDWNGHSLLGLPLVTTLVQAIVNRPGWVSGNSLAIMTFEYHTTPNEDLQFQTFDGDASHAPQLWIYYTPPPATGQVIMMVND